MKLAKEARGGAAEIGGEAFRGDPPLLLIVGSLDAGSRKDVIAYARGLAESQVVAKDACFVDACKVDGKWLYEVHEGGPGRALLPWIARTLAGELDAKVNVPIAGERVVSVSSVGGELVGIVYPPDAERHEDALEGCQALELGAPLAPYFGSAAPLRNAAAALFVVSSLLFLGAGAAFYHRGNAMDVARFAGRFAAAKPEARTDVKNLPSLQLHLAAQSLKTNSGYLSYLRFEKGRWTWAQASGGQAPVPVSGGGQ